MTRSREQSYKLGTLGFWNPKTSERSPVKAEKVWNHRVMTNTVALSPMRRMHTMAAPASVAARTCTTTPNTLPELEDALSDPPKRDGGCTTRRVPAHPISTATKSASPTLSLSTGQESRDMTIG